MSDEHNRIDISNEYERREMRNENESTEMPKEHESMEMPEEHDGTSVNIILADNVNILLRLVDDCLHKWMVWDGKSKPISSPTIILVYGYISPVSFLLEGWATGMLSIVSQIPGSPSIDCLVKRIYHIYISITFCMAFYLNAGNRESLKCIKGFSDLFP